MSGDRVGTHPREVVAQACAGSWLNYLAGVWELKKRFHVEKAAYGQERLKKREKKEKRRKKSERCVRAQPSSINLHLRRRRHVRYLPTYINVPRCLRVDQQQLSLMPARGSFATCYHQCPDGRPKPLFQQLPCMVRTCYRRVTTLSRQLDPLTDT